MSSEEYSKFIYLEEWISEDLIHSEKKKCCLISNPQNFVNENLKVWNVVSNCSKTCLMYLITY